MSRFLPAGLFCLVLSGLFVGLINEGLFAQESRRLSEKTVQAEKAGTAPAIDGRLDEEVWLRAAAATDFQQRLPTEGQPATQQSEVRFAYDEEALYIGATLYVADPEAIISPLGRRDDVTNAERIIIALDTYADRRTAYSFGITASGTRVDYYHPDDAEGARDYSYDPVWEAKTHIYHDHWVAEVRIPFSQLRFSDRAEQVWGLNLNRWIPSVNEDDYWVQIPQNENGWSSRFGSLTGITNIRPSRRLELLPYTAGEALLRNNIDKANPFAEETETNSRAGMDLKMGLGPNLTLDATINPDFGQVEADPAEVNLTDFETFFDERRPFFTEGNQLLSGAGAGYYYSRRIGSSPRVEPDADYVKQPESSTILGAAKVTGRLNSGLSIGLLTAVTAREFARTASQTGERQKLEVAPLSNFGVLRLQQEFGENGSTAGISLTGVERDLRTANLLSTYNRRAYSGGADWNLSLQDDGYNLSGSLGFSHIAGEAAAIRLVQENGTHYFQRPDAKHVTLDTTSTSMQGMTGFIGMEKNRGKWLWFLQGGFESPGFELNDPGRLSQADDIFGVAVLAYRETRPGRFYQNYTLGVEAVNEWNFDGILNASFYQLDCDLIWKNFWSTSLEFNVLPAAQSDRLTRGGPLMKTATVWGVELDQRNHFASSLTWELNAEYYQDNLDAWRYEYGYRISWQPGSRWTLQARPGFERLVDTRQYVETIDNSSGNAATYGKRYVFSSVDRKTIATQLRLNYSFSPDLTLELYAEPFNASGRFFNFGELTAAKSSTLLHYGSNGTTLQAGDDGEYTVTASGDQFSFEREDFNVKSLRSNVVLRWEWRPGSTFFLVWQQNREEEDRGRANLNNFIDSFNGTGDQFFALKFNYWIPVN